MRAAPRPVATPLDVAFGFIVDGARPVVVRRDLELDIIISMHLPAREVLDGRRVDKHIVLAVIRAADRPEEPELAAEPRAVAP